MKDTENNLQNIIFALDIGTRSVLGTVGVIRDKKFHVLEECYIEHEDVFKRLYGEQRKA